MKIKTSLQTLMMYAKALGDAKKSGNKELIEKCQKEHDNYKTLCLESDEMITGYTIGELYYGK